MILERSMREDLDPSGPLVDNLFWTVQDKADQVQRIRMTCQTVSI